MGRDIYTDCLWQGNLSSSIEFEFPSQNELFRSVAEKPREHHIISLFKVEGENFVEMVAK